MLTSCFLDRVQPEQVQVIHQRRISSQSYSDTSWTEVFQVRLNHMFACNGFGQATLKDPSNVVFGFALHSIQWLALIQPVHGETVEGHVSRAELRDEPLFPVLNEELDHFKSE